MLSRRAGRPLLATPLSGFFVELSGKPYQVSSGINVIAAFLCFVRLSAKYFSRNATSVILLTLVFI